MLLRNCSCCDWNFIGTSQKSKNCSKLTYNPIVSVRIRKINQLAKIEAQDNDSGILQKTLNKIIQPVFTTQPTGEVTGLGTS